MSMTSWALEPAPLDTDERLLWTVMLCFERQALLQYGAHLPALAIADKQSWVDELAAVVGGDDALRASTLQAPIENLLAAAARVERPSAALVVQGLVLERVRRVVYDALRVSAGASDRTRRFARWGSSISASLVEQAPTLLHEQENQGPMFTLFLEESGEILQRLDAVGESVDLVFGERFGLKFSDIVGEFVADLVPTCVGLGMDRRKVMSHLAGALMGL
jgi:hypothetical protein